mgnify:CR=1 FL=1
MQFDRELLASLSPGGSRERPIRVASASVVEVRTSALPCPLCGGSYRLDEHVSLAVRDFGVGLTGWVAAQYLTP